MIERIPLAQATDDFVSPTSACSSGEATDYIARAREQGETRILAGRRLVVSPPVAPCSSSDLLAVSNRP